MSVQLSALLVDAHDPLALVRFWSRLLDGRIDGTTVVPADDTRFALRFVPAAARKVVANRMHLDLTSTSLTDQAAAVDRALGLGARPIDVGQRPEEGHVVLADPEGNEFCVVGPDNAFLAGCGFVGAKVSWGGPPLPPRTGPDRVRFELTAADPTAAAERLLALGAERTESGDAGVVVLTDPDGTAFRLRAPA